jgi:hypothetical protein
MIKTAYYTTNPNTNVRIHIYVNNNAQKNVDVTTASAIPMRAFTITLRAMTPGSVDNAQNIIPQ